MGIEFRRRTAAIEEAFLSKEEIAAEAVEDVSEEEVVAGEVIENAAPENNEAEPQQDA